MIGNQIGNMIGNSVGNAIGGGPGVTPLSIFGANLALWLRADLGVTIGTGVSQWSDQSGSGNHVVQVTGSKQPSYVASSATANGRPVVRFASASLQYLASSGFTGLPLGCNPTTISILQFNSTSGTRVPWELEGPALVHAMFNYLNGGSYFVRANYTTGGVIGTSKVFSDTTSVHRFRQAGDESAMSIKIDNAAASAAGGTGGVGVTTTQILVGCAIGFVSCFDGDLAELILTNATPTTAQNTALTAYLNARYAPASAWT